jgi:transcriptional regulator with PAS, ATPase and Fis domain
LQNYWFPGNIRELRNIIENAVVMSEDNRIDQFIQASLREAGSARSPTTSHAIESRLSLSDKLCEVERELLRKAKLQCRSTRQMAQLLGISQPSVVRKLHKHRLATK